MAMDRSKIRRKGHLRGVDSRPRRNKKVPPSSTEGNALREIRGVGPRVEQALRERGIETLEDLLYLLPIRFEDQRMVRSLSDLSEGEETTVRGRIIESGTTYSRQTRKRGCFVRIEDGTGFLTARWFRFNKGWIKTISEKGVGLLLTGKVTRFGA